MRHFGANLDHWWSVCRGVSGSSVRRSLWALMILAHAPALTASWRSLLADGLTVERLGGGFVLILAMLFFFLKVIDLAFLRFRSDRRAVVASCLVVAILHVGSLSPNGQATLVPECAALAATTWLVGGLSPVRRILRSAVGGKRPTVTGSIGVTRSADTLWFDAFRPHCWTLIFRSFNLRAPPA